MLVHVIDFEGCQRTGIVEYGVVSIRGHRIESVATGLCRPDEPITPQETLVHGLKTDDLKEQPSFTTHREFFFSLRESGLLAAHSASVEDHLLRHYWSVVSGSAAPYFSGHWGPWIDSRKVAEAFLDAENYSLGLLIKRFGLFDEVEKAARNHCPKERCRSHCALYDALASAFLLMEIGARYSLKPEDLVRASQSDKQRQKSDFAQGDLFDL